MPKKKTKKQVDVVAVGQMALEHRNRIVNTQKGRGDTGTLKHQLAFFEGVMEMAEELARLRMVADAALDWKAGHLDGVPVEEHRRLEDHLRDELDPYEDTYIDYDEWVPPTRRRFEAKHTRIIAGKRVQVVDQPLKKGARQ